jgi:hypothetical protein
MLLLVVYTVGFCTNVLQISSKSIYYSLFISPNDCNNIVTAIFGDGDWQIWSNQGLLQGHFRFAG